jgi:hypothetical protein
MPPAPPPSHRPAMLGLATLLAALSASAVLVSPVTASEQDVTELACRAEPAPRRVRPVVVIDEPDKPLDARDPYFSEKLAARYRRWVTQVM